jgi:hypothetical protein
VWTVPDHTESYLLFIALDLKSMGMGLMLVSPVSAHEGLVSICECHFACWVCEVESFQVFDKNVFSQILDTGNIAALINRFKRVIILRCSVSNHFLSS